MRKGKGEKEKETGKEKRRKGVAAPPRGGRGASRALHILHTRSPVGPFPFLLFLFSFSPFPFLLFLFLFSFSLERVGKGKEKG